MVQMELKQREFKEWLEKHKPDEVVGRERACLNCPVANYLKKLYEPRRPTIHVDGFVYRVNGAPHQLPEWAKMFDDLICTRSVRLQTINKKITASDALEVLAKVTEVYPLEPKPKKVRAKDEDELPLRPKKEEQSAPTLF